MEKIMKRTTYIGLAIAVLAGLFLVPLNAQQEPLGDYARQFRKQQQNEKPVPPARTFNNDNLPREDQLSVVGPAPQQAADQSAQGQGADQKAGQDGKSADSDATKQKEYGEWRDKISTQKQQIDLLSRDLDVTQREFGLRAAAFYADAGDRLRNQGAWDKQQAQYKQAIAQKQKALDEAKKQLDDMEEEARKAGVPSSMRQ
jgi:hypothetical protein